MPPALAVFVKTPGRSPVKTRLAAGIGTPAAEAFYRACLAAVAETMGLCLAREITVPYWAVAEPDTAADPLWAVFETVPQGAGGLGDRLAWVYGSLLKRHRRVLLAGADAPLLSAEAIGEAVAALDTADFALARSGDGGYALFAGRLPLPTELWTAIPYSTHNTAQVFAARLRARGRVTELPPLDDIDTVADLPQLLVAERPRLTASQLAVVALARQLTSGPSASPHELPPAGFEPAT